jgi:hypothetical protein
MTEVFLCPYCNAPKKGEGIDIHKKRIKERPVNCVRSILTQEPPEGPALRSRFECVVVHVEFKCEQCGFAEIYTIDS